MRRVVVRAQYRATFKASTASIAPNVMKVRDSAFAMTLRS
jgi:hypothetical protein